MKRTIQKGADRTTDDRRNQQYHRSAWAVIQLDLDDVDIQWDEMGEHSDDNEVYFGERLRAETPDALVSSVTRKLFGKLVEEDVTLKKYNEKDLNFGWGVRPAYARRWDAEKDGKYVKVQIDWKAKAERPSLTPDEEEALSLVDIEYVADKFTEVVSEAVEFINKRNAQLKTLRHTERLADWIADEAQERAVKKADYESRLESLQQEFSERLKALKSEVKAETIKQGQELLDDEWSSKHVKEAQDEGFVEESIESAPKFWRRFISEPVGSLSSGFFKRKKTGPRDPKVKPEDLDMEADSTK